MRTPRDLVGYKVVLAETGISKPRVLERIAEEGIRVYVDGKDRRRRLISARDIPRLIETRPDERRAETTA